MIPLPDGLPDSISGDCLAEAPGYCGLDLLIQSLKEELKILMLLSADCGISGFPFYHFFHTASHGILVNVLLLILFLAAWDGHVDGLQGCQECLDGLWACCCYHCETQGKSWKSLLPEVQSKVRASHGQSVFQRVSGACRRDEGMLCMSAQPNLLCLF